jgi:O-antigen ligase
MDRPRELAFDTSTGLNTSAGIAFLGAGVSVAVGAAVGLRTGVAVAVLAGALLVVLLFAMPIYWFAGAAIIGTALVPILLIESHIRGLPLGATPLAGQARLVLILVAVALVRFREWSVRISRAALFALIAYATLVVFEVIVAVALHNTYEAIWSDLYRQCSYVVAFAIGAISASAANRNEVTRSLARSTAVAGIAVLLMLLTFWAWMHDLVGVPSSLQQIFSDARSSYPYGARVGFPFLNDSPNLAAVAVVVLAAFALPILAESSEMRDRVLGALYLTLVVFGLLATGSRTGIVSCATAIAIVAYRSLRGRGRAWKFLAVAIVGTVGLVALHQMPKSRALSAQGDTLIAREAIWQQATYTFYRHPVSGEGFRFSATDRFTEPATRYGSSVARGASVHNEYLGVLVDGGAIGAICFGLFLGGCVRLARAVDRRDSAATGTAAFAFLGAALSSMILGASLQSASIATFFWLVLGVQAVLAAGR